MTWHLCLIGWLLAALASYRMFQYWMWGRYTRRLLKYHHIMDGWHNPERQCPTCREARGLMALGHLDE